MGNVSAWLIQQQLYAKKIYTNIDVINMTQDDFNDLLYLKGGVSTLKYNGKKYCRINGRRVEVKISDSLHVVYNNYID